MSLLERRREIVRYKERAESKPKNYGVSEKRSRLIGMKSIAKDIISKNFLT